MARTVKEAYSSYKTAAKSRGIDFGLTFVQFSRVFGRECVYCGEENPNNGVDRVDSGSGYYQDNVVPCCYMCNWGKREKTVVEYIEHCRRVTAKSWGVSVFGLSREAEF